ncbi:hypothetical protein F4802DRAFT_422962 [Xylaria palmicola]|nr:hypothetical protein F4802DRAFT_422962 [Xylaria palmicola]
MSFDLETEAGKPASSMSSSPRSSLGTTSSPRRRKHSDPAAMIAAMSKRIEYRLCNERTIASLSVAGVRAASWFHAFSCLPSLLPQHAGRQVKYRPHVAPHDHSVPGGRPEPFSGALCIYRTPGSAPVAAVQHNPLTAHYTVKDEGPVYIDSWRHDGEGTGPNSHASHAVLQVPCMPRHHQQKRIACRVSSPNPTRKRLPSDQDWGPMGGSRRRELISLDRPGYQGNAFSCVLDSENNPSSGGVLKLKRNLVEQISPNRQD